MESPDWYLLKIRTNASKWNQPTIDGESYLFSSGEGKLMECYHGGVVIWEFLENIWVTKLWWTSVSPHEGKGDDCGLWSQTIGVKSCLCEWPVISSWTRLLSSLSLVSPSVKWGRHNLPPRITRLKWVNMCQALETMLVTEQTPH